MPDEDPLSNFIGNLAKKIQVAKDHKHIMEAVYASASATETVEEQEDPFASFLNKIGNAISAKLPTKTSLPPTEQVAVNQTIIQEISPVIAQSEPTTTLEIDQPVKDLAQKIKDAIEKAKFKAQHPDAVEQEEVTSAPTASDMEEPADKQITSYINELEKIKDTGTVKQQKEAKTTLEELKEYIDKAVYDYSRKILDLGGGGGSVAVQYANGGTMNGNLNVNGNYLSGGVNLLDIFVTSESDNQTLAYDNSNYNLSISNGNTVNLSAINTTFSINSGKYESAYTTTNLNSATWSQAYTNLVNNSGAYLSGFNAFDASAIAAASGSWNSNYTTTNTNSATWSQAYTNLVNNSAAYLSGADLSSIASASASWNSNYTTTNTNSASWSAAYTSFNANSSFYDAAVNELFTYMISETGDEFITEDSLLMVDSNIDGYPAWNSTTETVVSLSAGWQNAANAVANNASTWTSTYTSVYANSANWSAAYTNLITNSAAYLSGADLSLLAAASGSWNSNYTTTNTNSASWSNWSSVSGLYAVGTKYVKLSGDNMTGSLTVTGSLSTTQGIVCTPSTFIAADTVTDAALIMDFTRGAASGGMYVRRSNGQQRSIFNYTDSTGNIDVGTFSTNINSVSIKAGGSNLTGFINFGTHSTNNVMRIIDSGNIGIGTITPTEKLTVVGNISASGTLSANSINSNAYVANTGFVIADTNTSRIFTNTDNGKCITFSNTSPITASLPAGLPVGFNVMLIQINTGQVYLSAGTGVTVNSDGGRRKIASQHSAASLISYAANTFNLAGNLTA